MFAHAAPTNDTVRDDTAERHRAKYENQGIIHKLTLGRFHRALARTLSELPPQSILEFGCGEGMLAEVLDDEGVPLPGYRGIDIRPDAIAEARRRNPGLAFEVRDIFDQSLDGESFDVVLASQVLEHLFDPAPFLSRLADLSARHLVLTVPLEPWFQLMNLARGRDVVRLGNHPEHVSHWTARSFADFVGGHARVVSCRTVFPFIIVHAIVHDAA